MQISIDASGMNQIAVDLLGNTRLAPAVARTAVRRTAEAIKRDAQLFAPVDTGNLRSSITFETRELRDGAVAEIGPTANYGGYVEFGTSTHAPQAYMGPAFDRHAHELPLALERLGDWLDRL